MKKLILLALMTLGIMKLNAEEYNFGDHSLAFSQIEKEWRNQNLYTGSYEDNPNILDYFLGFSNAYPNDLMQNVIAVMLGRKEYGEYVIDKQNGYISAEVATELEYKMQMCHWRCTDGSTLVGVALIGYEYIVPGFNAPEEDPNATYTDDDDDCEIHLCVNDMMFYRVLKNEVLWRPIVPEKLLGRTIDFHQYDIELPRYGKEIKLKHKDNPKLNLSFTWDGAKFIKK